MHVDALTYNFTTLTISTRGGGRGEGGEGGRGGGGVGQALRGT